MIGSAPGTLGVGQTGILGQLARLEQDAARRTHRLSTGQQVGGPNNAILAGLIGIAQRFDVQVQGLNQATSNIVQGVSLLQTAEGGLATTAELLGRARELAVASANGTLTDTDRAALQAEFTQVMQQIDQTANATQFNGRQLLNGTTTALTIQTGANAGEAAGITLPNATTAALGLNGASIATQAGAAGALGQIDAALEQLSTARAGLGAQQNRLEAALANTGTAMLNQAAAGSRIENADLAQEMTALVNDRLRQSFALAMLSHTNLTAGAVLRLFGQPA